MDQIINLSLLLKTFLQIAWGFIWAFKPLLIPAIIWLIITFFVKRGVEWTSIVSGDKKKITRKKVKIAKDTVDLVSSVHDLNNK